MFNVFLPQVCWEQKGKMPAMPCYEAEVTFGLPGSEAREEDWEPLSGFFLQQLDDLEGSQVVSVVASQVASPVGSEPQSPRSPAQKPRKIRAGDVDVDAVQNMVDMG